MKLHQIRHARVRAMADFEEGHLPEAEAKVNELMARISPPASPQIRAELCNLYLDRATIHRFANRWGDALQDLEKCTCLTKDMGKLWKSLILANVEFLRAKIYSTPYDSINDPQKAIQALAAVRDAGHFDYACDELEAGLAFRAGEWGKAAALGIRAANRLEADGWLRGAASCRRIAGDALLEAGDLQAAEKELGAAHKFLKQWGAPGDLAVSLMSQARLHSACGDHDQAWELALEALSGFDYLIRRFSVPGDQLRFLIDKLERYQCAFEIALAKGGSEGCLRSWEVAERSKSFYLRQLIVSADINLYDGLEPQELARLRQLEQAVDDCELKLGRLAIADREGRRGQRIYEDLDKLSEEKEAQLERMMKQNPKWARMNSPGTLNLQEEVARLSGKWVPLSYYWQSRRHCPASLLHIFWRDDQGSPKWISTEWTRDDMKQLDHYRIKLQGDVDLFEAVFPNHLAKKVVPIELRDTLLKDNCLLISPHGDLQMLPLHAIQLEDHSHLIEHWPIQYIPSLALLPFRHYGETRESVLLLGCEQNGFGDTVLPDVNAELDKLATLWSEKKPGLVDKLSIEPESSPERAGVPLKSWQKYGYIHIACHGNFPESQPFNAALRLGSDALRASEFFMARLNAQLIALSACALGRTALRADDDAVVGDEWIGLILPLLYAGGRSVVASLWNANSETARFIMEEMHRGMICGKKPAYALQGAMVSVMQASFISQWSNWMIVGLPE